MTHLEAVCSVVPSVNDLQNCRLVDETLGHHSVIFDVFDHL